VQDRERVFQSNENKDFLRSAYDLRLIRDWFNETKRPLKYLGLPAWEMSDIIAWQPFLSKFTTIEREENQQHLMFLRANVKQVEHRLHALYGEFDEILLTGRDRYGHSPEWPYDLFNLDYFGGLLYSDFSRPKALRKVIENQSNFEQSFLLIITQHIRDRDTMGAKGAFLQDLRTSLQNSTSDSKRRAAIEQTLDWYSATNTPDAARQALYLNTLLRDTGEFYQFDVFCRPAIVYIGTGHAVMIHFVTEFRMRTGVVHKVSSKQTLNEVVNLGVVELRNQLLTPLKGQPKLPA
jgi:hypothetical protein